MIVRMIDQVNVWKWKFYGFMFHVFLACIFVIVGLLLFTIIVLCLPVLLLYCISLTLQNKSFPTLSTHDCNIKEDALLRQCQLVNSKIVSDWMKLSVSGISVELHSIIGTAINSEYSSNNKNNILWIHGVGGTATMSFVKSGVLGRLVDEFNVFALDLPGFGRSTLPPSCIHMSEIEYEELLMETILKYIQVKKLSKVFIMGHSFGAYHALTFAYRYPNLVNRLLLVGPGGIFQTPSKTGPFMSSIFSLGLPMYPLRGLGRFGLLLFHSLLWLTGNETTLLQYWYQVQASPSLISDFIVLRFFLINYYTSTWNRPAWKKLLELNIPVSLVFGEYDNISPPMQGLVASALTGSDIPIYFIAGGWHIPMAIRNGLDFSCIIKHSMKHGKSPCPVTCKKIVNSLPDDISKLLDNRFNGGIFSVYSIADCDAIAKQYYTEILKLRLMITDSLKKLTMPTLLLANGDSLKTVSSTEVEVINEHQILLQQMFYEFLESSNKKQEVTVRYVLLEKILLLFSSQKTI